MTPILPANDTDAIWLLFCTILVIFMQAGFCCLESGLVRNKNSINVALKNIADFTVTLTFFWAVGFGLMFGTSQYGWWGSSDFFFDGDTPTSLLFLFQAAFCGAAATIVSGAVAERMRFLGYLATTLLIAAIIYPVFGHWAWYPGTTPQMGWLRSLGFIDSAGATVVHSVGGWVALATVLILGPRRGFYHPHHNEFQGNNLPLSTLGVLILWIGWLGFNGGSLYRFDERVPQVLINTLLAGACGGISALIFSAFKAKTADVKLILNGILTGLVASTAACVMIQAAEAALLGLAAGPLSVVCAKFFKDRQIDDVVGALTVHLGGGILGTLSVALLADSRFFLPGINRIEQLGIQVFGILVCFLWAFGVSMVSLRLLNRIYPLRVDITQEDQGLNISEHQYSGALLELIHSLEDSQAKGTPVDPHQFENDTEFQQIIFQYNRLHDHLDQEMIREKQYAQLSILDGLTGLYNRRFFDMIFGLEWARMGSRAAPLSLMMIDVDRFKIFNDTYGHQAGDKALSNLADILKGVVERSGDFIARYGGEEFCILLPDTTLEKAQHLADKIQLQVQAEPIPFEHGSPVGYLTLSIGIAARIPSREDTQEDLIEEADKALYTAKHQGRNQVVASGL